MGNGHTLIRKNSESIVESIVEEILPQTCLIDFTRVDMIDRVTGQNLMKIYIKRMENKY